MFDAMQWLPQYEGVTAPMLFMYAMAGMFGALVRIAWLDKPLRGLYRDKSGALMLGAWGELIVGIGVAVFVGGHPIQAGLVSVFGPAVLNTIQAGVLSAIRERSNQERRK
jgi:hypothetical protein